MRFITVATFLLLSLQSLIGQNIFSLSENGEAPSRSYDVLHYKLDITID